jgi:hypothetical protein
MDLILQKSGFHNSKSVFLTVKGDGKYQKMDIVVKLCKKISSTFFLVREKNKIIVGYHYHAIIKLRKPKLPPKNWFRKGVHMHISEICPPKSNIPPIYDTKLDIENYKKEILLTSKTELEKVLDLKRLKNKILQEKINQIVYSDNKKIRKLKAAKRILQYMCKELEFPEQYVNYYLQIRGKSHRF